MTEPKEKAKEKAVSITYFDPFDLFESVKSEFAQILPLDNVHWRSHNGVMRTVNKLDVNVIAETSSHDDTTTGNVPFIKLIIVSCNSVEEYRSKVRPLLKQWLPEAQKLQIEDGASLDKSDSNSLKLSSTPIIFFYSNSEVVDDSSLFKTVSILDKFAKNFPHVQTLELKSVYRSPNEKKEFWNQLGQQIKAQLLEIFQQRVTYFLHMLSTYSRSQGLSQQQLKERLYVKEKLFDLYFEFNLVEEGSEQLMSIKRELDRISYENIEGDSLEIPFNFKIKKDDSLTEIIKNDKLNKFYVSKYFFLREFTLLKLEDNSNLKFLKIYKQVRKFINSIDMISSNDENLLEFKYYFLEAIISNIPTEKLTDATILLEIKAEFVLMKRDCWLNGVLNVTDYKLIGKTFPSLQNGITYKFNDLIDTYKDEDTFHETFINYNKELLSLYNECDGQRKRIIDILSLEIGTLYYQRKEYTNAVSLFISCYEYYTESNWDIIGFNILKMFVDSLEKSIQLETIEVDGNPINKSTILGNSYLNIIKLSKSEIEEKKLYWEKYLKLQGSDDIDLAYPMKGLLQVELDNTISLSKSNVYSIPVILDNNEFLHDISIDYISLTLRGEYNKESKIVFAMKDTVISQGKKQYILETSNIKFGRFIVSTLEVSIGNTRLIEDFYPESSYNDNDINREINGYSGPIINIHEIYSIDNVAVKIEQAKSLELGEYALYLSLDNYSAIKKSNIKLKIIDEILNSVPVSFNENEAQKVIEFENPKEITRIPYYLTEQISSFSVEVQFSFEKVDDDESYCEEMVMYVECYLPVSVSVEDIFKRDTFFFKFLLSSSLAEEPIILHSSKLNLKYSVEKQPSRYDIIGNLEPESPLILLSSTEDSCLNCYRIRTDDKFNMNDIFNLKVSYNTLKELLDCLVTDAILVQGNIELFKKFSQWKLLWERTLLSKFRYDYDLYYEERVIKFDSSHMDQPFILRLGNFIKEKFTHEPELKTIFLKCLKDLFKGVQISNLAVTEYTQNLAPRELIVPVELPEFEHFYSVQFSRIHDSDNTEDDRPEVGIPIPFNIKIENMGAKWGQNQDEAENDSEHLFEILNSNEWLLQGKKRFAIPSDNYEFQVKLIPLKKGHLTFPHIEINNTKGESSRIDIDNAQDYILVL